ncbi:MAG: F0F1 ATP synthase subunit B [Candidatus Aminicenantia bacterium]
MNKLRLSLIIFLTLFLLNFAAVSSKETGTNWSDFLGKVINFVVLFGLLIFFLLKPLKNYLEKRTKEIRSTITHAEESRKEAEEKFAQLEKRLSHLQQEIEEIRRKGEKEAQKEREKIIFQGKKEVERIKLLTRKEIDRYLKSGLKELKHYAAELSITLAEKEIKNKLTPQDHKFLIDKYIEKLDKIK